MPAVGVTSRPASRPLLAPNRISHNGITSSAAPTEFKIQRRMSGPIGIRVALRRYPLFFLVVKSTLHCVLDLAAIHPFDKNVGIQETACKQEDDDAAGTAKHSAGTDRDYILLATFLHFHVVLLLLEVK